MGVCQRGLPHKLGYITGCCQARGGNAATTLTTLPRVQWVRCMP